MFGKCCLVSFSEAVALALHVAPNPLPSHLPDLDTAQPGVKKPPFTLQPTVL